MGFSRRDSIGLYQQTWQEKRILDWYDKHGWIPFHCRCSFCCQGKNYEDGTHKHKRKKRFTTEYTVLMAKKPREKYPQWKRKRN